MSFQCLEEVRGFFISFSYLQKRKASIIRLETCHAIKDVMFKKLKAKCSMLANSEKDTS